ncbi:MAG: pyridoxamine 5'-phosphate oxidase family protein [Myxococcota bacterium]|nr:pyridoxamine 5'-phosphate oxidase family protein [Myxococcota bacterium]
MSQTSPFHAGEKQVQARLGVSEIEDWARKIVRPYLPDEHRAFHTALPFLVAAARDGQGRPWATLLVGDEGFVTSPDDRSLVIEAQPGEGDALEGALTPGADLGLLGIEFATRRRNRLNGRIAADAKALVFQVDQTFGNCPQYIHERDWRRVTDEPGAARRATTLSESQQEWIRSADTFFIASGYRGEGESPTFGMDASHRGGDPGFVRIEGDGRLVFPDYAGNNHFNTIGNMLLDPRAGYLFIDFETGSLLQITGHTRIDWDSEAVASFPGARRLVVLDVEEVVEVPGAIPLRFDASADSVRSVKVVEKRRESEDVVSFVFASRDGGPLPEFAAGQHLPIELEVPGTSEPVRRTYSLSGDPAGERYRITVKREPQGVASRHLHDRVTEGAILPIRKPAGDFMIGCTECPVVLVSAGVGLTPMVSMLHELAAQDRERPVWFVHGARDGRHHPLAEEVRELASRRDGIRVHTAYSRPLPEDAAHDHTGRVDGDWLATLVDRPDAHYFLCGPVAFMAGIQSQLEARGVPADQIHSESFGPVG